MPRLIRDGKSGIWFFRWPLPKSHQQSLNQKNTLHHLTDSRRKASTMPCSTAEPASGGHEKIPNLNEDAIRNLLEIDMERGIFRADTPEEQERGLKILENLGRMRDNSSTPPRDNKRAESEGA
jgi:hypothetical protein